MIIFALEKLFPSLFTRHMNLYTVVFTCQRGRANNYRTVRARHAGEAQRIVEETTPTLAQVSKVRDYNGPAAN